MPKRMTGRKVNVLMDELGYSKTTGGLYCIYPFANLKESPTMKGDDRKGCFKLGMTSTSFVQRMDSYHTAFPVGVFYFAFLGDIPIPPGTRARPRPTKKSWYLKAETFLFKTMVELGGERIYSTARIKELGINVDAGGVSEYFYCSLGQIHEAFNKVWAKFGGDLKLFNAENPGDDFNKMNSKKISTATFAGVVPFV